MNVKLKMSMLRQIKDENYQQIYKDDYATLVYVALRILCKKDTELKTTINGLYQSLSDAEPSRDNIKGIKEGLQVLSDQGFISFKKKGLTYSIRPLNIDIDTGSEKYFLVPIEYINLIMSEKSAVKLLHHYLLLCSTINVLNKTGNHDMNYFVKELNTCINTICNQRKKFAELNIISFSESKSRKLPTGEWINIPKVYTMPENNEIIMQQQDNLLNNKEKKLRKSKRKVQKENELEEATTIKRKKKPTELPEEYEDDPFSCSDDAANIF